MRRIILLIPILLLGGLALGVAYGEVRNEPQEAGREAAAELSSLCGDCHESEVASFGLNPHSILGRDAWREAGIADGSCTSCHAGGAAHIDEGGGEGTIFAFHDSESAAAKTRVCMGCHADSHPRFAASPHAAGGLDCTSCHALHQDRSGSVERALLRSGGSAVALDTDHIGPASASCAECHANVLAEFDFNERHRLREGVMDCTSCHDPHAPSTRLALGGFKQEACVDCHTDKGGPYVFEHGSERVEGCTACHSPHGSVNRHMLSFQNVAQMCYSCHAAVPGFHSRFTLETQCTNCHSSIHGSNFDPYFLK